MDDVSRGKKYVVGYLITAGLAGVLVGVLLPGTAIVGVGAHPFALPSIIGGATLLFFGIAAIFIRH